MLLEEYDYDVEMEKIKFGIREDTRKETIKEVTDILMQSLKQELLEIGMSEKDVEEFEQIVLAWMEEQMKTQETSLTQ